MAQIKFGKPKEKIKLKPTKGQGLTKDNKVKLKGNKKGSSVGSKSTKSSGSKKKKLQFIKLGNSSYPDRDDDPQASLFRRMARAETDDSDYGSDHSGEPVSEAPSFRSGRSSGRSSGIAVKNPVFGSGRSSASSGRSSRGRAPPVDGVGPPASEYSSEDDDADSDSFSSDDLSSLPSSASSIPMDRTLGNMRDKNRIEKPIFSNSEADEAEKQDILARLHILKQRGIRLSKNYTTRSSLAELRLEMGRIEHEMDTQRAVQRMRRWLMAGTSGMEYATSSKYAPRFAKNKLYGFSNYVLDSIEDYDPAFERMSEKYGGVIGIGSTGNPLADIAVLLLTQAFMFIFIEHKAGVKPPTAEEVKKEYPDMVNKMAREMADKMRAEEREHELKMQQAREQARNEWMFQQSQARQQGVQQVYTGGFPRPVQVTAQQMPVVTPMQAPSIVVPEQRVMPLPVPQLDINTEDNSVFDLRAAPAESDIKDSFDVSSMVQQVEALQSSLTPQPFPTTEKLPEVPFTRQKTVEMPMSTRKGKDVKINEVPPKPALKKEVPARPEEGLKRTTITIN